MTSYYNSKIGMGLFHEQSFTILLYFFSVLIAHNGFVYDFPLLFAEVDRRYPLLKNDLFKHICFGDSLVNLRTVRLRDFNFNAKKKCRKCTKNVWILVVIQCTCIASFTFISVIMVLHCIYNTELTWLLKYSLFKYMYSFFGQICSFFYLRSTSIYR